MASNSPAAPLDMVEMAVRNKMASRRNSSSSMRLGNALRLSPGVNHAAVLAVVDDHIAVRLKRAHGHTAHLAFKSSLSASLTISTGGVSEA